MYSILEHKHRSAAWASGRGASVIGCRFSVEQGKKIIEESGLKDIAASIDNLPSPDEFDEKHREWRKNVIKAAKKLNITFRHGVAAKLINIYFKSIFVCGNQYEDPRVKVIHPPIDSVLLDTLYRKEVGGLKKNWQRARKVRWSKFNSDQYEDVISSIKSAIQYEIKENLLKEDGLWQIEKYWSGHQ